MTLSIAHRDGTSPASTGCGRNLDGTSSAPPGCGRNLISVTLLAVAAALAATALEATAHAEEQPAVDKPSPGAWSGHAIDRSWLYLDDARTADPGGVIAATSISYTSVGSNPDPTSAPYRAFAFNTAQPGELVSLGGEVGLLPRLSLEALGQIKLGGDSAASPGAVAGLRFQLSPSSWRNVHLVASAGYLRETWSAPVRDAASGELGPGQPNGDNGAWFQAAGSVDIARLRLGLTAHGEHVFADGRDGVDVMVKTGASYRLVDWFRVGVEWVGQDLEGAVKSDAEGGARHFVGPTAALALLHERLSVVAGPSLGLSDPSPKLLGRLAIAYGF